MNTHSVSRIEALESRIAPAVAVVVVDSTGGVLSLTGDSLDHEFSITALGDGSVELKGAAGTVFQMGTDPDTDTLRLTGPIKSLTATLGDGVDTVSLAGLSIGGDVAIDLGEGINALTVNGLAAKGSMSITGGSTDDTVTFATGNVVAGLNMSIDLGDGTNEFHSDSAILKAAGNFTYTGLAGEDTVALGSGSVRIGGSATFTLGAGDATLSVAGTTPFIVGKALVFDSSSSIAVDDVNITLQLISLTVGTDLVFNGGAGDEEFASVIQGGNVGGAIRSVSGGGTDKFQGYAYGLAAKSLQLDSTGGADSKFTIELHSCQFPGGMKVEGGAGVDEVNVTGYASKLGSVVVDLGEGDNSLGLFALGGKFGPVTLSAGAGKDTVAVGGYSFSMGAVMANLGDGENSLGLGFSPGKIGPITFHGGADMDTLTVNGDFASIARIVADMGEGENKTEITVIGGTLGSVQITGGAGEDAQSIGLSGAKLAGGIDIRNGDGIADTEVSANGGTSITGLVRAESDAHPGGSAKLTILGGNSTIGGIDFIGGEGASGLVFKDTNRFTTGLTIKGALRVTGGSEPAGNVFVDFNGVSNTTVKKGILIDTGAGSGGVMGTVEGLVSNGFKFIGGNVTNTLVLSGNASLGVVSITLGDALNTVFFGAFGGSVTAKTFALTSATVVSNSETITLTGIRVLGNFSATLGAAESAFSLHNANIGGTFTLDTGDGTDNVSIGVDPIGAGVFLSKAATIRLGDGDDTLNLGGPGIASLLTTKATFKADGGAGTNTLINDPDNVFAQTPVFTSLP